MNSTSKLMITLDEEGVIIEVTENGEPLNYDDGTYDDEYEKYKGATMEGSQIRSTASTCCWRKVRGRWICRDKFCK